jgi:AcrR family transcriptional regulator
MLNDQPKRRGRPPSGAREAILAATLELLREQGIARFTTPDVAARAGVSEASIFYHFRDRAGLLQAVFAEGLRPLQRFNEAGLQGDSPAAVLRGFARTLEEFLDQTLMVIMAAQSDADLRESLAAYMVEHGFGPHRGVQVLARYLRSEQDAGRIRAGVDVEASAALVVSSTFLRSSHRQIMGNQQRPSLPSMQRTIAAVIASF